MIARDFWEGRKVFLTGHTGFKGAWMATWLRQLGAQVHGYALPPGQLPTAYHDAGLDTGLPQTLADINDLECLQAAMLKCNPDVVFHLAAQSLVKYSYSHPVETFATNVMGTVNLLAATSQCTSLKAVVVVTTDKCYRNQELEEGYHEEHPLGGYDPYSSSKACAELVASSWRQSFLQGNTAQGIKPYGLATVRAGNVIGGGDWALDRLVPDVLRAVANGEEVVIRNPDAIRPWQYVIDPLAGYLMLAEKLITDPEAFSGAWNFGPARDDVRSVGWLVERLLSGLGQQDSWRYVADPAVHETSLLHLDCSKARSRLGWRPYYGLERSIERIIDWQQIRAANGCLSDFMIEELENYMATSSMQQHEQ